MRDDRRHEKVTVPAHLHPRPGGRDPARGAER